MKFLLMKSIFGVGVAFLLLGCLFSSAQSNKQKPILLNIDNSMIVKKKLNPFYSRALKRGYLEYIPVDFFINIKGVKLIFQKS